MFKSLKQKIATGEEGVSPGRQTPLRAKTSDRSSFGKATSEKKASPRNTPKNAKAERRLSNPLHKDDVSPEVASSADTTGNRKNSPHEVLARVQHLLEVGKAQAENNGLLDQNDKPNMSGSDPLGALNGASSTSTTPGVVSEKEVDTSQRMNNSHSTAQDSAPSTPKSTKSKQFELPASAASTPGHERSDSEMDNDTATKLSNMSHEDLIHFFRKQEKILGRYKTRFSEVVDAYKGIQKEKEKLESTLTSGQDKQLRRITELKETVQLEQEAKRHMEETLRLTLEEKEDMIKALQTKVDFLKEHSGDITPSSVDKQENSFDRAEGSSETRNTAERKEIEMQKKIELQESELEKYKEQLKDSQEVVSRVEQEKKTALQEIMENMQKLIAEKNELKSEIILYKDDLAAKNEMICSLKTGQEIMKKEIEKELKERILEEAILRQEKEMQAIYQRKENDMKLTFAEKVKDFQRLMEQKQETVKGKEEDIEKLQLKIAGLENDIKEFAERESTLKAKVNSVVKERGDWEKKFYDANAKISEEEAKMTELVQQHNRQLKLKQDEQQQQVNKVKRASQNKINELQETIKQNESKILEMEARFSKDIESKQKEQESQKHVEISKVTRKYESKFSDLKKMIKDLRSDVSEKISHIQNLEGKISELETKGNDSESIVAQFESRIEELNKQLEAKDLQISEKEAKIVKMMEDSDARVMQTQQEYEATLSKQNTEMSELKGGLANWEKELKELEIKYKASEEELKELGELNSSYKTHNEKLEKALQDSETKLELLNQESSQTKMDLEQSLHEKDDHIENISSQFEKETLLLREECELKIKTELPMVENVKAELHEKYSLEIDNLKDLLKSTKMELEIFKENKENIEESQKDMIDELNKKYDTSDEEIKQLKHDKGILEERLQRLMNAASGNETDLRNQVTELEFQLSENERGMLEVSKKLDEKIKETENLETALKEAQYSLLEKEERINEKVKSKDKEIADLNERLEKVEQERHISQEAWEGSKEEQNLLVQELRSEIVTLTEAKGTLETSLNEKMAEFETERDRMISNIADMDEKLQLAESELNVKDNRYKEEIERFKEASENELEDLLKKNTIELESYKEKLESSEKEKQNKMEELERSLHDLQNELAHSRNSYEERKLAYEKNEKELQLQLKKRTEEVNQKSVESENDLKAIENKYHKEIGKKDNEAKKKIEELQLKYKKIIADKEKKHAAAIENAAAMKKEETDKLTVMFENRIGDLEESYRTKIDEHRNTINDLNRRNKHSEEKLLAIQKQTSEEIEHYKGRENEARENADRYKTSMQNKEDKYQEKIVSLEKELSNAKALQEEMSMKIQAGETSNRDVDMKFREIVQQKKDLEEKLILKEQENIARMKEAEQQLENQKKITEELKNAKEEEMIAKIKEHEKSHELSLERQGKELEDQNRTKLLDMKRKAETKIANIKKQHNIVIEQKDTKISELIGVIEELRSNIDNVSAANDRKASELSLNYENDLKLKLDELEREKNDELNTLKESLSSQQLELVELRKGIQEWEDKAQQKTIEKVEALKAMKQDMEEEHTAQIEKIKTEMVKKSDDLQKKYDAQVDDKDYEYSARVKKIIKEFQAKLSEKDQENDHNLSDTIDRMQKEEQRIVEEYEEQIAEFKRELKLRDDDMQSLKLESEKKLKSMESNLRDQELKSEGELLRLEKDYDERVRMMSKNHEEELEKLKSDSKHGIDQHQIMINDVEQRHVAKIAELEEIHKNEKASIEKRLRTQMKKNQNEMKRLLADKMAASAGRLNTEDEDWELMNHLSNSNANSDNDNESDTSDTSKLKSKIEMLRAELKAFREREKSLKIQLEKSPRNGRPDSLNISANLNTSTSGFSSPSTPEPIEYEYLKNILFQYMMGKQRKQMVKVLAAIVHFTPSQTQQVLEKEEQFEYANSGFFGHIST